MQCTDVFVCQIVEYNSNKENGKGFGSLIVIFKLCISPSNAMGTGSIYTILIGYVQCTYINCR